MYFTFWRSSFYQIFPNQKQKSSKCSKSCYRKTRTSTWNHTDRRTGERKETSGKTKKEKPKESSSSEEEEITKIKKRKRKDKKNKKEESVNDSSETKRRRVAKSPEPKPKLSQSDQEKEKPQKRKKENQDSPKSTIREKTVSNKDSPNKKSKKEKKHKEKKHKEKKEKKDKKHKKEKSSLIEGSKEEISTIHSELRQALDSESISICKGLLQKLGTYSVSMDILKETALGKTIKKLRKYNNKEISSLATKLLTKYEKQIEHFVESTFKSGNKNHNEPKSEITPVNVEENNKKEW